MFEVVYNYFDTKGNQKQKKLSRATLQGLINAFKKDLETKQLYQVVGVSRNLKDYDFRNDGIEEF